MQLSIGELGAREIDLADLWRHLAAGRYFATGAHCAQGRCFVELERQQVCRPAPAPAVDLLRRMFTGESQKVLASELDVSLTTIAVNCAKALRAMVHGHLASRAPLLLVMAAHAERGLELPPARIHSRTEQRLLLSVEIPTAALAYRLSPGEFHVAQLLIEGKTHAEIAHTRGTALRTTANQLHGVFEKLRVSGRSELRVHAIVALSEAHRRAPGAASLLAPSLAVTAARATRATEALLTRAAS